MGSFYGRPATAFPGPPHPPGESPILGHVPVTGAGRPAKGERS